MAQKGNLSTWAGQSIPSNPDFSHRVSAETNKFLTTLLHKTFEQVTIKEIKALRDYQNGETTHLFRNTHQGTYKVTLHSTTLPKNILVHVKPQSSDDVITFGASLFCTLNQNGIETCQYLTTSQNHYHLHHDDYNIYFTDHSEGFHPFSAPDILYQFGQTIGKLETELSNIPKDKKAFIRKNSKERYDIWQNGLKYWKEKGSKFTRSQPDIEHVFDRCADFLLRVDPHTLDMNRGTPNHFDLTENNTLIIPDTKTNTFQIRILDGDTISSGWSPQHYDLGTFAFRVGLNMPRSPQHDTLPDITEEMLAPLLQGFNKTASTRLTQKDLAREIMRASSLVMMVISDAEAQNSPSGELKIYAQNMTQKILRNFEYCKQYGF